MDTAIDPRQRASALGDETLTLACIVRKGSTVANEEHLERLKDVAWWNQWREDDEEVPDLSGANLIGANLADADLRIADLRGAHLSNAVVTGANLLGADLQGADLTGAKLSNANLTDACLQRASLFLASASNANLSNTVLTHANLCDADLSHADLTDTNLTRAELSHANLTGANLTRATLVLALFFRAKLTSADLTRACLGSANLTQADLTNANLTRASIHDADFTGANLTGANLTGAGLEDVKFNEAILRGTHLQGASILSASFNNCDLSGVKGLDSVSYLGPSSVGLDTIYKSRGKIPESFLRGCGVRESFIARMDALVGAEDGMESHTCFISYSSKDMHFAKRLHGKMRDAHLRVWFAPQDLHHGRKLDEQIETAIRVHDKLLIVLSEASLQSEWVRTELRKAPKAERLSGKRKFFPVRLTDMETVRDWECFDVDSGQDLAVELREYFIPDFSRWKEHDQFEAAFTRLLKDLKADSATPR